MPVKEVEGLRNLNQGLWQGLTIEEVRRKYPKVAKQWQESPETVCPPEGETVAEALDRVKKVLRKAMKRDGDVALVVCEPLATLISCVVQGCKLELPDSITGAENNCKFEVLAADGRVVESCSGETVTASPTAVSTKGAVHLSSVQKPEQEAKSANTGPRETRSSRGAVDCAATAARRPSFASRSSGASASAPSATTTSTSPPRRAFGNCSTKTASKSGSPTWRRSIRSDSPTRSRTASGSSTSRRRPD